MHCFVLTDGARCAAVRVLGRTCGTGPWVIGRFVLLVTAVFVALGALLLRSWIKRATSSSKEVQILKIVFSHLQMISIMSTVQLKWPGDARGFLNAVDTTSSFSTSGLAVECLLGHAAKSPFLRTIVFSLMPLGLLAFAALFWTTIGLLELRFGTFAACMRCDPKVPPSASDAAGAAAAADSDPAAPSLPDGKEGKQSTTTTTLATLPTTPTTPTSAMATASVAPQQRPPRRLPALRVATSSRSVASGAAETDEVREAVNPFWTHKTGAAAGQLEDSGSSQNAESALAVPADHPPPHSAPRPFMLNLRDRMFVSVIILAFLVHTPLSTAAFRLLTCREVAPEDDSSASELRLVMDLTVLCTDPQQLMVGLSVPILLVVSLGIPFAAAAFLRSIGREGLQDPAWRSLVGFLVNGYKPDLYYWESVVLLRKVSVALVTTLLTPAGPGIQVTTALIVLLGALVLHTRYHPYVSNVINSLASLALVTAALSFVCAQYIVLEEYASSKSGVAAEAASVTIVVTNVLFLVAAFAMLSDNVRRRAKTQLAVLKKATKSEEAVSPASDSSHSPHTPQNPHSPRGAPSPQPEEAGRSRNFLTDVYRRRLLRPTSSNNTLASPTPTTPVGPGTRLDFDTAGADAARADAVAPPPQQP
jgi:hypothetical protein